jgi:hypothetical protein
MEAWEGGRGVVARGNYRIAGIWNVVVQNRGDMEQRRGKHGISALYLISWVYVPALGCTLDPGLTSGRFFLFRMQGKSHTLSSPSTKSSSLSHGMIAL